MKHLRSTITGLALLGSVLPLASENTHKAAPQPYTHTAENGFSLNWKSQNEQGYFIQYSPSIGSYTFEPWVYLPITPTGNGNILSFGFALESSKLFFQIYAYDLEPGQTAGEADVDLDGLSSAYEFLIGTDPMKLDSNNDGINDGAHDYDEDGRADGQEATGSPSSVAGEKDNPKVKISIN